MHCLSSPNLFGRQSQPFGRCIHFAHTEFLLHFCCCCCCCWCWVTGPSAVEGLAVEVPQIGCPFKTKAALRDAAPPGALTAREIVATQCHWRPHYVLITYSTEKPPSFCSLWGVAPSESYSETTKELGEATYLRRRGKRRVGRQQGGALAGESTAVCANACVRACACA